MIFIPIYDGVEIYVDNIKYIIYILLNWRSIEHIMNIYYSV